MKKLLSGLFRAIDALLAGLLAGMVLMVLGNVVLRYVFNSGVVVSEELSRFFFVWLTFIGAIVAMREGTHLGMDNVVSRLPRKGQLACLAASQLLIVMCCAVLLHGTWRQHDISASTVAPVTGMPMIWIFGMGYVCGLAIGAQALHTVWRILRGRVADHELVQVREAGEGQGSHAPAAVAQPAPSIPGVSR